MTVLNFTNHNFNGLVFIGDPHLWSKTPGSRIDNYTEASLKKFDEAITYCVRHNYYPIILGDLFHTDKENDIKLLSNIVKILKKLPIPCATIEGNHEKSQTKLSEDVALFLLQEAQLIYVLEENGIWGNFKVNNKIITVGGTPYGSKIPQKIDKQDSDYTFWLSHHDLDFGETYPGVIPVHEIENVDFLINGHIHKTKPIKQIGKMTAFNPGNITRLSKDCIEHIPNIWIWNAKQATEFIPHTLKHNPHCFLITETNIKGEESKTKLNEALEPIQISSFVENMEKTYQSNDYQKTDDGTFILQSINVLAKTLNLDMKFSEELISLAEETIKNQES